MPQLIVTSSRSTGRDDDAVTMREWVTAADLESRHFVAQLIERLVWAVDDANDACEAPPGVPYR